MNLPGEGFEMCFSNKEGFKRNSNHNIVSGDIGTVPGLKRSTSIIKNILFHIYKIIKKLTLKNPSPSVNHSFVDQHNL